MKKKIKILNSMEHVLFMLSASVYQIEKWNHTFVVICNTNEGKFMAKC